MGLNRFWRGINGLFKQTHSIFLKRAPLGSGLPCEFGLDFGSNIECNCHLCSHSSCTYFLLYLPLCCKSKQLLILATIARSSCQTPTMLSSLPWSATPMKNWLFSIWPRPAV